MPTVLNSLADCPIVQAPMAGGASGPPLAAAVCEAGALGFLAAGYRTAAAMHQEIRQLRSLTARPFGVNLFLPQPVLADLAPVEIYRDRLAGESDRYATAPGDPHHGGDDEHEGKLAVLLDDPVPFVSFTFGCPTPDTLAALARAGTRTLVTVTSPEEARAAQDAGADGVCVQGIEAGGHQGTHHDNGENPRGTGLLALLGLVRAAVTLPMVAAGGLMRGEQVAAVLAAGAELAQLGTAFLATDESGAPDVHKAALTDPRFAGTELTRAFSGRPARALTNRFLLAHGSHAPAAYPAVHHVTAPLRRAAAAAGDPQGMALWAGQGYSLARAMPAGRLVDVLKSELSGAQAASRRE